MLQADIRATAEEERLEKRREQLQVGTRLGQLLLRKNLRGASTVMKAWDKDCNSVVDCDEFMMNVRGLGLKATDEELTRLFRSFDIDGSATMELSEMKQCLYKLQVRNSRCVTGQ